VDSESGAQSTPSDDVVVDNAYAHLTIGSHQLGPDEMIDIVGVEPFERWRMGDAMSVGPEGALHSKHGIQYRSRLDESVAGDQHLYDLIDFIRDHKTALAQLTEHDAVESALLGLVVQYVRSAELQPVTGGPGASRGSEHWTVDSLQLGQRGS